VEVYLNNAATTWPKPEAVYRAADYYLRHFGASQGRGSFQRSREATDVIENSRTTLARLFGVSDPARLIFTQNCSLSLNLAIKGILRKGDHVVTSSMEHNSVWRPLKTLEQKGLISLTEVQCQPTGKINLEEVSNACRLNTRLLVSTNASNVTGIIFPIAELTEIAHSHHALILVDAAQTAGVLPIHITGLGIDLLACSGHKGLLGPQGTGALYISPGLKLGTLLEGGTGSMSLSPFQPDSLPSRFETGTLNGPGIAGLGAGIDFILETGVEKIRQVEHDLTAHLLEKLQSIPGIAIYGPQDPDLQVGVVSFNLSDANPEEVATVLDKVYGIMVRTGLHCAPEAHRTIGTIERGTVRVSPGYFNTTQDIGYFIDAMREVAKKLSSTTVSCEVASEKESADYVKGYRIVRSSPCFSDENKIRVIAEFDRNIEDLLPYVNAVIRGAYHAEGRRFTFSYEKRPVILEAQQVILGKTENSTKAIEILDAVVAILNKVARERDNIKPSNASRQDFSPYALYKHLPRTNCGKCGEKTCLALAIALVQERYCLAQCHPLQDPSCNADRMIIQKMLDDYLGALLPTGEEYR
jgi:cysteine desulfurase/selenocysteine lyase